MNASMHRTRFHICRVQCFAGTTGVSAAAVPSSFWHILIGQTAGGSGLSTVKMTGAKRNDVCGHIARERTKFNK